MLSVLIGVIVAGAIWMLVTQNMMHLTIAFLMVMLGIGGVYLYLQIPVLAASHILLYVGGVLVLVLFGIMITSNLVLVKKPTKFVTLSAMLVLVFGGTYYLTYVIIDAWERPPFGVMDVQASTLGLLLTNEYILAFELSSLILLVSIMGAALVASRVRKPPTSLD